VAESSRVALVGRRGELTADERAMIQRAFETRPVMAAAQADSVAADVATLVSDFNALLAKLRVSNTLDT
jgi:hypothetical protein